MYQAKQVLEQLEDVYTEVARQEALWGVQMHPDGTGGAEARRQCTNARNRCEDAAKKGTLTYWDILKEEFFEAGAAEPNSAELIEELTQLCAVAQSWIRTIRNR